MARIDQVTFSHRAIAGTALTGTQTVVLTGGSAFPSGSADPKGVVCLPGTIAAGKPVSVLKKAELVEFGGAAGTDYFAQAGGSIGTAAGGTQVGYTVEGDRLIIDM